MAVSEENSSPNADNPNTVSPPSRPARFIQRWAWLIALVLVTIYAGLTFSASLGKGASYDESEELAVGYDIWLHQDFRMEGANGDLVKRWATLPFLVSKPSFPGAENPDWLKAAPYGLGYQFFFGSGNESAQLLRQGRLMVVLLGVATALLVFYCSKEVFGPLGGLFSLALFVFSPDMLAFGGIVSTEMSLCLALLGATWCIWRLLHKVTWGRLLASMGFLALLFLAKATALVIFPITAVLVAIKIFSGEPLEWQLGRSRVFSSHTAQGGIFLGLFAIHGIFCWAAVWAHYDFRYAASPDQADPKILAWRHTSEVAPNPTLEKIITWSRTEKILPEGYLDGMDLLLSENLKRLTFMHGKWALGREPTFFPYAIWAKTSPVLLLLLGLGTGWWVWRRIQIVREQKVRPASASRPRPIFYQAVPYVALIAVFFTVAVGQNLNIAHRHILPIYPAFDILAGGFVGWVWSQRQRFIREVIVVLLVWYAHDAVAIYPNYLAYFSPAVGGSAHGYQNLVESSLDWGMDLPKLKTWLNQHNPRDRDIFYLAYFGTDNPDYYQIKSTRLPSFPAWESEGRYDLMPGIYAISATLFESFYIENEGPWNKHYESEYQNCLQILRKYNAGIKSPEQMSVLMKQYALFKKLRFNRLCAWLRHNRQPDDNVGHSILIWRLTQGEIDEALYGAPAELVENSPLIVNKNAG